MEGTVCDRVRCTDCAKRMSLSSDYGSHEWKRRVFGAFILALIFVSLGAGCLARQFNHDEGQFVASGVLLARAGLLPYIHYPYFHLPNLVFVYAALFATNDFLLLTARSFNVVCAWLLLLLIYGMIASAFRSLGEKRWTVAIAFTLFFALHPIFRFTAGRAWNHDLPMLTSVAALAMLLRGVEPNGARGWMPASGAMLAIAAGTRLTFLPLVVPFLALTLIFKAPGSAPYHRALVFLIAFTVALLPTLTLFAVGPKAFLFDNFTCNGLLNLRFRQSRNPHALIWNKLLFPFEQLRSPATLLVVLGFALFACWCPLRNGWRNALRSPKTAAWLLIVPFALIGAFLPSPSYLQYYYAPIPFLVLGAAYGIARCWPAPGDHVKILRLLAAVLAISFLEFLPDLRGSNPFAGIGQWPVWSIHRVGLEIRKKTGARSVLTLAPIYPLEGGASIYPQFCTGPFAWRIAPFAKSEDRERYGLVGAQNLDAFLAARPAAILTNYENATLEGPIKTYAERNDHTRSMLSDERGVLWLPP